MIPSKYLDNKLCVILRLHVQAHYSGDCAGGMVGGRSSLGYSRCMTYGTVAYGNRRDMGAGWGLFPQHDR